MNEYITIPLSKTSKEYTGPYETIVSIEDADLIHYSWRPNQRCPSDTSYACRGVRRDGTPKTLLLHRVILSRVLGREIESHEKVDHIDGNGLNNTRENLRLATSAQNSMNRKKRSDNTSGYKGVSWCKGYNRWKAQIGFGGIKIVIGFFHDPKIAYEAYCEKAKELHGEFARFE